MTAAAEAKTIACASVRSHDRGGDEQDRQQQQLVMESLGKDGKGITVYGNTPLLGGVNDTPESINALAYGYRKAGIEFHHLYLAGQPLQRSWNAQHPVDLYDVVDIATRVRREGSGREIPRYIIGTVLGEVDFGLTSSIAGEDEDLSVKLAPYDLAYFTGMEPAFTWPANVTVADDGRSVRLRLDLRRGSRARPGAGGPAVIGGTIHIAVVRHQGGRHLEGGDDLLQLTQVGGGHHSGKDIDCRPPL